ncbi:MAG: hydantoinase/oxoprolinase family protein [Mesorhizobium sp.]|uniref:hydantoinase/oxoprolinase family protein n=1 Tax=Mesorhizobium sp. TaxID=1871066 RepID=UPI000FE64ACC|nr:hydantoinase/oxoprolinase family protein [Mesorhizobium sp.]RWD52288.1 MAG: hydantoinase/oxoprolinase family protein [Mesorhizobium sp.]RWE61941.1 MAG: hydantoinase/oxoprolinase family protein [Mesorhizobium sp.]RWF12107.1 MAG: hydantoinase/oxoprolinase family protein [Mesorhizobium sp.]TIY06955.1 MAG: hydantoinase/oxoprolinase family protein [Mesorhizobium sp.]
MAQEQFRIGVDVGGTFTDLSLIDEGTGELHHFKTPSTPHDPSEAIQNGLRQAIDAGFNPKAVSHLGHGTTVATNMIIERKGTLTGLLTTKGFRDVLEIARQQRPHLYDYSVHRPAPLVDRWLRLEVSERFTADGDELIPLDEAAVRAAAAQFRDAKVAAVAVCFVHAYRFDSHERRAGEILREELPGVPVSLSSEVQPEFREFERFSTTVMNAYLTPKMTGYLDRLMHRSRELKVSAAPHTVHSNGGLMSMDTAKAFPVRTCLSGPAAGVVGAAQVAQAAGFPNAVTFDVGGTSTDVSLILNGRGAYTPLREVAGYPVRCPMVDVHVIGAGGGSIAWVDDAGALKAGPQSAGAVPGPVGYMRGGTEPTITDANLHLGRLNPVALLNGAMPVDRDVATQVVSAIGRRIGASPDVAADGIIRIAVANMARAIRAISIERGCDVKEFALVAFGGAGPLHAPFVADEVGIPTVLIPEAPGTMCARGVLLSNVSQSFVSSHVAPLSDASWREVLARAAAMRNEAQAWLADEQVPEGLREYVRIIEARYVGQNFEVRVEGDMADREVFVRAFYQVNDEVYGYHVEDRGIEIVNIRIEAIGRIATPLREPPALAGSLAAARIETRSVHMGEDYGGWTSAAVYDRARLPTGASFTGPTVIEELTATTLLPPGWSAEVDCWRNLILTRNAH